MDLIYSTLYVLSLVAFGAIVGAGLLARSVSRRTGKTMIQVLRGDPGEERQQVQRGDPGEER
jgi:hypothetical protein